MAPQIDGNHIPIIDIRRQACNGSMLNDVFRGLRPEKGKDRTLPTMVLYDEKGLRLFEDITYLDEYYLTNAEIEVLNKHAADIAKMISPGSRLIELGSGNLRKIKILLDTIEDAGKDVQYYALDLSLPELERTFSELPKDTYKHVQCYGLLGTYDDGLLWLKQQTGAPRPLCILTMGSSVGNFNRDEAAQFLHEFAELMGPEDLMLVGLDACQDEAKVLRAYNDREGITHDFIRNGLTNINGIIGKVAFDHPHWEVVGEYNDTKQCHQAFYQAKSNTLLEEISISAGERIRVEESYKYSSSQRRELWRQAGLIPRAIFGNKSDDYRKYQL